MRKIPPATAFRNSGFLLSLAVCVAGCSRAPFTFVPASGKISYDDGSPLPIDGGLRVIFVPTAPPLEGGIRAPQAAAYPDASGNFAKVSSTRPGGGMAVGEYKVAIMYEGVDANRFVPKQYISPKTTPLAVHTDNVPFDIKIPKPH
jgi:hypothetical protein